MDNVQNRFAYRAETGLRTFAAVLCFILAIGWTAFLAWWWSTGKPVEWQEVIFPAFLFGGGLLNVFQFRRMRARPELALKNWRYDIFGIIIPIVGVLILLSIAALSALHI